MYGAIDNCLKLHFGKTRLLRVSVVWKGHALGWMLADKWKRSVLSVLTLWEGWGVCLKAFQDHFTAIVGKPPPTAEEEEAVNMAADKASVAYAESHQPEYDSPGLSEMKDDIDIGLDGEPMPDAEDLDGGPVDDEDVDGKPMENEEQDRVDPRATKAG
ncbi:hypothetical protein MMC22_000754 [Lobaria immixta]|nr:hypothetical protein [Lobaria immixta]